MLPKPDPVTCVADPLIVRARTVLVGTQFVNVGMALLITLLGGKFWLALLYSFLIGNCISAFTNGGRLLISRWLLSRPGPHSQELQSGWPGWHWVGPLVLVGGTAGYLLGSFLADAITGNNSTLPGDRWRIWLLIFGISTLVTLVITWFFYSRAKLASTEAAVQALGRTAAETQLKLLESQLEPHMLFNTLANLRALIAVDPAQAQQMLDQLIQFLRATLNASRSASHPLSAEFERLGDYLGLMGIRMGPRLRSELSLPPDLAALPVPPLLLQPLVENAIKHGLERQRKGGTVWVTAQADGAWLQLTVEDDGAGGATRVPEPGDASIAPPAPPADPSLARRVGTGFGLSQVRDRLAAQYGPSASLALAEREGGGTRVTLRLPLPAAPAP